MVRNGHRLLAFGDVRLEADVIDRIVSAGRGGILRDVEAVDVELGFEYRRRHGGGLAGQPGGARIYDRSQTRREHGERGEGRTGAARVGEEGGEEEERGGEERGEQEASAGGGGDAARVEVHCHGLRGATSRLKKVFYRGVF